MKLTFVELMADLQSIIFPARYRDGKAQPLESKGSGKKAGIKLNNPPKYLNDDDLIYVKLNKSQLIAILLENTYFGVCSFLSKEEDEEMYLKIVKSIDFLNKNLSYSSIFNKDVMSDKDFYQLKNCFDTIKEKLKIPEEKFLDIFSAKKIINDLNRVDDANLARKKAELNDIELEISTQSLNLNNLNEELDKLKLFKNENKWLDAVKPYFLNGNKSDTDSNNADIEPLTKVKSKPLFDDIVKSLIGRFDLSNDFIHCYLLSLFTSLMQGRFLLLTGHIGTGKSSIIKETGKLLGGQTNMVAVRPAWLDASDLLGYFDPINNRYHSTDFVRFIKQENNNHINMILLDELNIARIENYGADILACLAEIGERDQEQNKIHLFNQDLQELIHTYQLFAELTDVKKQKYQHILERIKQSSSIIIPDNVLICGTLNIDGSTENLSPKMIDRSFMLKFPDFDGQLGGIKEITEQVPLLISQIIHSVRKRDTISVQKWNGFYSNYIESIKDSLIPISNRVAKDYLVFCQFAEFFGVDDEHKINALFFYARILPRLRIEKLDDNIRQNILSTLNSFANIDLFSTFVKEISHSKNNGNFIDYQHICG